MRFYPKTAKFNSAKFRQKQQIAKINSANFFVFSIANFNSAKYFYLLKCLNNVSKIKVEGVVPPVQLRNYEKFVEIIWKLSTFKVVSYNFLTVTHLLKKFRKPSTAKINSAIFDSTLQIANLNSANYDIFDVPNRKL